MHRMFSGKLFADNHAVAGAHTLKRSGRSFSTGLARCVCAAFGAGASHVLGRIARPVNYLRRRPLPAAVRERRRKCAAPNAAIKSGTGNTEKPLNLVSQQYRRQ